MMTDFKGTFRALILTGCLALSFPALAQTTPSLGPSAVVTKVVALVSTDQPTLESNYNDAMQAYFSDAFNADFMKAMSYSSDRVILDGNPITGLQNGTNVKLIDASVAAQTATTATVKATISYVETGTTTTSRETLTFSLILENNAWHVDEVSNGEGLGTHAAMAAEVAQGPGPEKL